MKSDQVDPGRPWIMEERLISWRIGHEFSSNGHATTVCGSNQCQIPCPRFAHVTPRLFAPLALSSPNLAPLIHVFALLSRILYSPG